MISFIVCLLVLIVGYFTYGKYVEKTFGPDDRLTPAITMEDGVDYVEMPAWRIFLIQLLNIAGLGPIWGAIGGALWGPSVFLWITLGTIFVGGVHDYASGFVSMRDKGKSVSEISGDYMGENVRRLMRVFSTVLLFMVGVVFAKGPAGLIGYLCDPTGTEDSLFSNTNIWLIVIIIYYFIATFVPIDAIIGRIYPIFGICLAVMAIGVGVGIFVNGTATNIPEISSVFGKNMHPSDTGIWPMMFISVACGAVSGFHATQSPLMARCCRSEKQARKIFYGAMTCEGILALVWAAASCALFPIIENKMIGLQDAMELGQSACVYNICETTMGKFGVLLAMLGVIACPITSGDTAFRSARLTIADWFDINQSNWKNRLLLAIPLLGFGYIVCQLDYNTLWSYFASTNQILAMIVLWTAAVYLIKNKRNPMIAVVPATFMSAVTMTCVVRSDLYLGKLIPDMTAAFGNTLGILFAVIFLFVFTRKAIYESDVLEKLKSNSENDSKWRS